MKAKNLITQVLFVSACFVFITGAFCEEEMQLELLWKSPKFERESSHSQKYFFDPVQKELRYLMDEKIVIVNSEGKVSYKKKYNDIIAFDRQDSIYLFEKGKPLSEIENIFWLKTDLACRKHFSNSMNCFAQFILKKDGNLILEMFKWDSDKNDYILQWRNENAFSLIEAAGRYTGQKLPDVYVSTRCTLAIKTNIGDFCSYPNSEKDAIWFYDDKGKMIATFFSGDEYFYECEKYDSNTRIPGGIIEGALFSEDGTKLLIQGRSKNDVHDQVFLILNEKGEIIWNMLIPCEEYTEPSNCMENSSARIAISSYNRELKNFKTLILGKSRFRLPGDFEIKYKAIMSPVIDFNNTETVVIEALRGKIIMIDLIKNIERNIASFSSEDGIGSLRINQVKNHIHFKTEKYLDKSLPTSTFWVLNSEGKKLKKIEFDGSYYNIQISNDEQLLFTNSGTFFSLYRIK